jgi:hypothetical protein
VITDEVAGVYFPKIASNSDEPQVTADSRVVLLLQELASKVGLYQNSSNQQLFRVFVNDGKLMAGIVGRSNAWELTAASSTRFTFLGAWSLRIPARRSPTTAEDPRDRQ